MNIKIKACLLTVFLAFIGSQASATVIDLGDGLTSNSDDFADHVSGGAISGSTTDSNLSSGYAIFWPHGAAANRVTVFNWNTAIRNGIGDDLVFFMRRPSGAYGATIGLTINGISMDITARTRVSAGSQYAGIFAATVNLSDFNVADGGSISSVSFNGPRNIGTYGTASCNNYADWGNCSDILLAGVGSIQNSLVATVPLPTSFMLMALGLIGLGYRRKTQKNLRINPV